MMSYPYKWLIRNGDIPHTLAYEGIKDVFYSDSSLLTTKEKVQVKPIISEDDLQLSLAMNFSNGSGSHDEIQSSENDASSCHKDLVQHSGEEHYNGHVQFTKNQCFNVFNKTSNECYQRSPSLSCPSRITGQGTVVLFHVEDSPGAHKQVISTSDTSDSSNTKTQTRNGIDAMFDEGSTNAAKRMKGKSCSNLESFKSNSSQSVPLQDNLLYQGFASPTISCSTSDEPCCPVPITRTTSSFKTERTKKLCKFQGCSKGARGATGLCITHGGGRRCQKPNCNKGAESCSNFCKAHGGGRRCQYLGCIKSAEGKTDFCIGHGGGRRCCHEGCTKAARGKSGLCIRHGGGKRCQREGCTKSAEGLSGLCISHGGGRRCQYPDCTKGAQGSTSFCKGHGGGKRCTFEGCTKGAEGSTSLCKAHGGGKRCAYGGGTCSKSVHGGTAFCVAHGGGKRCSFPGCTKSARGRTDCCVRHGGGKRCKFENCTKSAQGSTDFCKAHGGGSKCVWCNEGSANTKSIFFSKDGKFDIALWEKLGTRKTCLCAMHKDQVRQAVFNSNVIDPQTVNFPSSSSEQTVRSAITDVHDLKRTSVEFLSVQHGRDFAEGSVKSTLQAAESEISQRVQSTDQALVSGILSKGIFVDGTRPTYSMPYAFPYKKTVHSVSFTNAISSSTPSTPCHAQNSLKRTRFEFQNGQSFASEAAYKSLMEKIQQGQYDLLKLASSDLSLFSLSAPEERVHGGGLMALLEKEAAKHAI